MCYVPFTKIWYKPASNDEFVSSQKLTEEFIGIDD